MTALCLFAIGVVLAGGGLWLIALGGSWYYALAGGALIGVGCGLWWGQVWALRLYWATLACTFIWSLLEAGLDPWALAPRLVGPVFIGLWLSTPWPRARIAALKPISPNHRAALSWCLAGVSAVVLLSMGVGWFASKNTKSETLAEVAPAAAIDWLSFGRTLSGTRYAPAGQITKENVGSLEVAWQVKTGDWSSTFEATPLAIDDVVIFCTGSNIVMAVDGDTGAVKWRYDPKVENVPRMHVACRGVSYHRAAKGEGVCAQRVFVATIDARLIALDVASGAPCPKFGKNGIVSLLHGMGPTPPGSYYVTSPPTVVGENVITGAFVLDNQSVSAPSGVVRSFDAQTGALRWAWDMGRPDRRGAPTHKDTYTQGTPNAWSIFSADPALELVYIPTGNPQPDFWGGKRRNFDERFGSSIVALDVATGAPRWVFQTVHHDVWDYDVPSQPVLMEIRTEAGTTPALVQSTKRGEIFVLDRRTGKPIFTVDERATPQGAAPGDALSSTQPFSAVSIAPPPLSESDMWGVSPIDQMFCRIWFKSLRYDGAFTPPGLKPTLKYPGAAGVTNWGGVSIDEKRQILVFNSSVVANVDQLVPRAKAPAFARQIGPAGSYEWGPQEGTPYVIRTQTFQSRFLQVPCTAPPWGRLNAIDLTTGKLIWSRPLGTARDSGPFQRASHLPLPMGVPNQGGAITTQSGLTFVGASVDHYLRAFDTVSGTELWRGRLPAAAHATPITYVSKKTGRQIVVVAAGGHLGMGPHISDTMIAFVLPDKPSTQTDAVRSNRGLER